MSRGGKLVLCIVSSVLLSGLGMPAASAEVPCSGQLPNGGSYDLGTACHTTWEQAERDVEQTLVIVNNVLDNSEGEAQQVIVLANQLVENTEVFVWQVVAAVCDVKPDLCA